MTEKEHELLADLGRLCRKHKTMLTGGVFDFPEYQVDVIRVCETEATANIITRGKAEGVRVELDGNN